jgi:hypothetical protein
VLLLGDLQLDVVQRALGLPASSISFWASHSSERVGFQSRISLTSPPLSQETSTQKAANAATPPSATTSR